MAAFPSSPVSSSELTYTFDLYCTDFTLLTTVAPFEALVFGNDGTAGLEGALLDFGAGVTSPISKLLFDSSANLARLGETFRGRESDFPPDETTVTECGRFFASTLLDLPGFNFSAFTAGTFLGRVAFFCMGGV